LALVRSTDPANYFKQNIERNYRFVQVRGRHYTQWTILATSLHDQAGFIRVCCCENNKLNRNHQPFPACDTVIDMNILFLRKVYGFDGKLMQSIVFDVFHESTPCRSVLKGELLSKSEEDGVNSITADIRRNLRKYCGKSEEKDGRTHSHVDLDHPFRCAAGITRSLPNLCGSVNN